VPYVNSWPGSFGQYEIVSGRERQSGYGTVEKVDTRGRIFVNSSESPTMEVDSISPVSAVNLAFIRAYEQSPIRGAFRIWYEGHDMGGDAWTDSYNSWTQLVAAATPVVMGRNAYCTGSSMGGGGYGGPTEHPFVRGASSSFTPLTIRFEGAVEHLWDFVLEQDTGSLSRVSSRRGVLGRRNDAPYSFAPAGEGLYNITLYGCGTDLRDAALAWFNERGTAQLVR
jgi:hypothetical protein